MPEDASNWVRFKIARRQTSLQLENIPWKLPRCNNDTIETTNYVEQSPSLEANGALTTSGIFPTFMEAEN
jgi:hypothetical protein